MRSRHFLTDATLKLPVHFSIIVHNTADKDKYLAGILGNGIVYGGKGSTGVLVGYVDSDYAGDTDNRKSTIRSVFL